MAWWLWVLLGFALVMCELLTPGGFFFLFFGLGAVAVGALVWLGAAGPAWLQWFLFSLISIGFLVPLRGRLLRRMAAGDDAAARVDALVGQVAVLLDDLPPGEVGKAALRRTAWNARHGFPHPPPLRRRDPLPPLAQGECPRYPGADLHHEGQRPGARRRRPLPEGDESRAGLLRRGGLSLRDHPARADGAAQRDRQD